jgi:hypothetical protein
VVAGLPEVKVPIPASVGSGGSSGAWLLTTYLDGDTRIARGDGGSVFVLTRVWDRAM